MLGYFRGWDDNKITVASASSSFRTGDKGYIDSEGYLFVNGRTKYEYKLSNGKYVDPQYIETLLSVSPNIEQIVVFGEGMRHNKAVIYTSNKSIDRNTILKEVRAQLEGKVQDYEVPQDIVLVREPFTHDNGLLTQKLEPNRRQVLEKYG